VGNTSISGRGAGRHIRFDPWSWLSLQLIADELVLQLATFLRSLDLFLELTVRTVPRTLTANQVRRGGKQGTDGPELSRIHSSTQHPRDKRREGLSTWRHQVPSHDVRGIGTSLTPSAQIEPRLSNAKMMILRSEGAMWLVGAFPRFSPAWDYFAADSIVSPSCVISTDSTLTSLPLALKLGPSILVTQALLQCQRFIGHCSLRRNRPRRAPCGMRQAAEHKYPAISPEIADHQHRLLRARRNRPRRRCAAEQRDELASSHSITSSARASSVGGTSRPRAFAVLRLIVKKNRVGCSIGKSVGFAPFNILSTYNAARLKKSLRVHAAKNQAAIGPGGCCSKMLCEDRDAQIREVERWLSGNDATLH
jgi:hypothetical protein